MLQAQLGSLVIELSNGLARITLRRNFYRDPGMLIKDLNDFVPPAQKRQAEWCGALDDIANKTQDPILKADVAVEKVLLANHQAALTSFHAKENRITAMPVDPKFVSDCKSSLSAAVEIYSAYGVHERRLRAQSCLADLLSFSGDTAGSDKLLEEVAAVSKKMSYVNVEGNSMAPLSKIQERIEERNVGVEADEVWASQTEEDLTSFAKQMLHNIGLSDERLANVLSDVKANQQVCRERLDWCDQ
jgi:hypothetical protein